MRGNEKAAEYWELSADARAIAAAVKDPMTKQMLAQIARGYEALARRHGTFPELRGIMGEAAARTKGNERAAATLRGNSR